jgi:hypothetical protein
MSARRVTVRIVAPHFVAGVDALNGRVVHAAPILHYMRGWDARRVAAYCARKGWTWQRLAAAPPPPPVGRGAR